MAGVDEVVGDGFGEVFGRRGGESVEAVVAEPDTEEVGEGVEVAVEPNGGFVLNLFEKEAEAAAGERRFGAAELVVEATEDATQGGGKGENRSRV